MGWFFDQAFQAALAIILGLLTTALTVTIARVWMSTPPHLAPRRRVAASIRLAPRRSATVAALLLGLLSIAVVGIANGGSETPRSMPPASVTRTAEPKPTATSLAQAGWGPSRDLARESQRPESAMINSIVDHVDYGDERNFTRIKDLGDPDGTFKDSIIAVPGHTYRVAILVNNDARDAGETAQGVKVRVQVSAFATGSEPFYAFGNADNTNPKEIWDGGTLVGKDLDSAFDIRLISDSARYHTGGGSDESPLSDDLFDKGVLIGCDALDGSIPAGKRCQSYLTYDLRIDQPNFQITAEGRSSDTDSWSNSFVAQAGTKLTLKVRYSNSGTTQQKDVRFHLTLPPNLHVISGSAKMQRRPAAVASPALEGFGSREIDTGSFNPDESAVVTVDLVADGPLKGKTNVQKVDSIFEVATNNGTKTAALTLVWL